MPRGVEPHPRGRETQRAERVGDLLALSPVGAQCPAPRWALETIMIRKRGKAFSLWRFLLVSPHSNEEEGKGSPFFCRETEGVRRPAAPPQLVGCFDGWKPLGGRFCVRCDLTEHARPP